MFGRRVHQAVLDSGDTETGVTIHHVTNDYDTGDVIAQCVVSIIPGDAVITIEERVKEVEKSLICGVIQNWNYSETE
ncbi:MAG: formyltransferase family protein [Methylobacter sp.]|uniref:phosphoribosylglycinamide formyltransferase 1 n=1 Tax=Candidatus Methylobacter titanis TaxID=3053457 RepID=A0AA43TQJ6_9GAMM|nr:formyltransferase family protein [Candidatus Methylobacter titanis]MDI1293740.1 formyltransferase family protein [Candidatus Methylobacter titanis]